MTKVRSFFIPLLGILSTENEQDEPEIVKNIKRILRCKRVRAVLDKLECDQDVVQSEIDVKLVPSLLDFDINQCFFNKNN